MENKIDKIMGEVVAGIAQKNPTLGGFLMMGLQSMNEMKTQQEEWKDRLLKEWEESKKMPRKLKKKRRKEILIDWSIANYDPFNGFRL
jgi:hypothetical protein